MKDSVMEFKELYSEYKSIGDYVLYKKDETKDIWQLVLYFVDYDYFEFRNVPTKEFGDLFNVLINFEGKEIENIIEIEDIEFAANDLMKSANEQLAFAVSEIESYKAALAHAYEELKKAEAYVEYAHELKMRVKERKIPIK